MIYNYILLNYPAQLKEMGNNCPYAITDDKLRESEEQLMRLTGIPYESFERSQVYLNVTGDYARTIRCGKVRTNFCSRECTMKRVNTFL